MIKRVKCIPLQLVFEYLMAKDKEAIKRPVKMAAFETHNEAN
jgi:hypothetical protein